MSIEQGTALVRHWQGRFGLGNFRLQVRPIDMDNENAWAHSFYELTEEWGVIELPVDGFFPPEVLELLVLHELAHGLIALATEADGGSVLVEQSCNRVARLARGDFTTPLMNEHRESVVGESWYGVEGEARESAGHRPFSELSKAAIDRRKWLSVVADALPEDERAVIAALYYENLSMRQTATSLGVDVHTVFRRRASALEKLRRYYVELDGFAFGGSDG